jgi:hypothetical protein
MLRVTLHPCSVTTRSLLLDTPGRNIGSSRSPRRIADRASLHFLKKKNPLFNGFEDRYISASTESGCVHNTGGSATTPIMAPLPTLISVISEVHRLPQTCILCRLRSEMKKLGRSSAGMCRTRRCGERRPVPPHTVGATTSSSDEITIGSKTTTRPCHRHNCKHNIKEARNNE